VLGLIRADGFLDGRMPLDLGAARAAVAGLGEKLGLTPEQTAAGILKVNNAAAANLIRQRTIQQGLDPRDFAIYAFGGAGPVHAFGFARELGVRTVVIPLGNGASTLSAFGIAASDVTLLFDEACEHHLPLDTGALACRLEALDARAEAAARDQGLESDRLVVERIGFLRYRGQYFQSLALPLPDLDEPDFNAALRERFNREYVRLYGEGALVMLQDVELFSLRARVTLPLNTRPQPVEARGAGPDARPPRPVFWPEEMRWTDTAVWNGETLRPGDEIVGPAILELAHTTVAVAAGQRLRADDLGNFLLELP
jgi:N-methylhydantoinase A